MPRINVLWVIDHVCYDGSLHGGGRLFWNLLPHFQSERVNVTAAMLRADDEIRSLFEDSPFPVRILDKSKFDPTTLTTFLRILKEDKIDVMHLHCYAASTFGRLAGLIRGVPAIIHDYDTEVYFPYPSYLWAADRMLAPSTAGGVAASPMCRSFMMERRQIAKDRIRLMFHAIPPEKFRPVPQDVVERLAAELEIPPQAPVVANVTKLGPQRGNEYLLRAFAEVVRNVPDAVLLLIYQVTYFHRLPSKKYVEVSDHNKRKLEANLEGLAKELGIVNNVRFVPSVEHADALISRSDLVAAPFQSERFSSVRMLDALAQGKPLVATDIGEQREIVENGVNGYLVSGDDPGEMASRIAELLQDRQKLGRFGEAARASAKKYSIESNVEMLTQWYEDLAELRSQ